MLLRRRRTCRAAAASCCNSPAILMQSPPRCNRAGTSAGSRPARAAPPPVRGSMALLTDSTQLRLRPCCSISSSCVHVFCLMCYGSVMVAESTHFRATASEASMYVVIKLLQT
ncbi:hypothetical protein PVAP13_2KG346202 [Panicum virgatum]|uniref:Uncharacterized protein n=1 Tax=Panicum virgatum TaxID=38727 RepID=A0A8T0WBG7_PANVG|nr:hypothetical protein PVAP13_2KG346202 [Panicum virgatum]